MMFKLLTCIILSILINSSLENCSEGYSITDCSLECGLTSNTDNYNRIVGGSEAIANSWPSMTLIYFSYSAVVSISGTNYQISSSSLCGGTLIDKSTVLTAAHCVKSSITYTHNGQEYEYQITSNSNYPTLESTYTVYLGVHDRSNLNSAGTVAKSVNKIIVHSGYNSVNYLNDIALFKLTSDASLNSYIQVACLPSSESTSYPSATRASYAAGWGTLSSGGSASSVLRDVDLTIYSSSLCSGVATSYTKDWSTQICAGDLSGNKDTCQGDSGGPMFIKESVNGQQKYVAVGITSYGVGCAQVNTPAIYTRISYYYDWIRSNGSAALNPNFKFYLTIIVLLIHNLF